MVGTFVPRGNRLLGPLIEKPEYNPFKRHKIENEYLQIFNNIGLGTTIWSPLAAGLLTGKYNDGIPEGSRLAIEGFEWLKDRHLQEQKIEKVKKLQAVADKLECKMSSLSIAWCISNPNVTTAILGATRREQLEENLKALDILPKLTPEVLNEIDAITGTKPELPQF